MSLIEELKAVHQKMQDPANWHPRGICDELWRNDELGFRRLAASWPKFSGNNIYPLPGADDAYHYGYAGYGSDEAEARRMWDRENSAYAALRWELLEWCIARLEQHFTARCWKRGRRMADMPEAKAAWTRLKAAWKEYRHQRRLYKAEQLIFRAVKIAPSHPDSLAILAAGMMVARDALKRNRKGG